MARGDITRRRIYADIQGGKTTTATEDIPPEQYQGHAQVRGSQRCTRAQRDRAVVALTAALQAEKLNQEVYDQRCQLVRQAETVDTLDHLTRDIGGRIPRTPPPSRLKVMLPVFGWGAGLFAVLVAGIGGVEAVADSSGWPSPDHSLSTDHFWAIILGTGTGIAAILVMVFFGLWLRDHYK